MLFDPANKEDNLAGKTSYKANFLREIEEGHTFEGVKRYGTLSGPVGTPLFTFIGRLSEQKGIDILIEVLGVLLKKELNMQMVLLGQGNDNFESRLIALSEDQRFAGRVYFLNGLSPELANRIFAAGDFFIVPSRYEPCGLTDFIAQLFGNIPIVHHVGGLVKVKDGVTGIAYQDNSLAGLLGSLEKALALYGDKTLKRTIQQQGIEEIQKNYTWTKVMRKYLELYKEAKKTQVCQQITE